MKRGIRRIIKRIGDELKATIEIAKKVSCKAAINTLIGKIDIQIMVHTGRIEYKWIRKNLMKKHKAMNEYFKKIYENYKVPEFKEENPNKKYINKIWVCWWQGESDMPEIVRKCIKSIKKNAGDYEIIIITDDNYNEFVNFPKWIMEKYKNGIITKTHLSDLLRLEILSKYGGIWLDSTFYCTGNLEKYFELPFWSIKRPDYRHTSVACGSFANYSFGCDFDNREIFWIIKNYLLEYWKKYDYLIDYLFLDYIIVYCINNNELVMKRFNEIQPNNPQCDELLKLLNSVYDKKVFEELIKNTDLFKLSWKLSTKKIKKGKNTFYSKL